MDTQNPAQQTQRWVRATDIGEFVRHNSCLRRFALGYDNQAQFKALPFSSRPFHTMDLVLSKEGKRREAQWAVHLENQGIKPLNLPTVGKNPGVPWGRFQDALMALEADLKVFEQEISVRGTIGGFTVEGRIDFAVLRWQNGAPRLWLVECKASRRDRTYQRIQAVIYLVLVRALLQDRQLTVAGNTLTDQDIDVAVVRIDEARNTMIHLGELRPLGDAASLEQDLLNLLAEDGPLVSALEEHTLDELPYQLSAGCDDCQFAVHCLPESARCRRLELLGLEPALINQLQDHQIDTLDDLAALKTDTEAFGTLQEAVAVDIEALSIKAQARLTTLPGNPIPDAWELMTLPNRGYGQLPPHRVQMQDVLGRKGETLSLIRVYITLSYDYAENRLCALTAHITRSPGRLFAPRDKDTRKPQPGLKEWDGHRAHARPFGHDIIEMRSTPWTGHYDLDTGAEAALLQNFFARVVEAIQIEADGLSAPLHFYFWSRGDMNALIEACARGGQGLLHHLRELLGSREGLEQLITSYIQTDFNQRFARGWTGSSLAIATSLRWFGKRYHWVRRVGGRDVDLAQAFRRDIFDTVAPLPIEETAPEDGDGSQTIAWSDKPDAPKHPFELRSSHTGGLTMPYWHALWGQLPTPQSDPDAPEHLKASLGDYHNARRPGLMRAFLMAHAHALRWLDERMQPGNKGIDKPPIDPDTLPTFQLGTHDAIQAALDFLYLDHHVGHSQWLQFHLTPPYVRVLKGASLPLCQITPGPKGKRLRATLDTERYGLTRAAMRARSSLDAGSFIRLNAATDQPHQPQPLRDLQRGGHTCVINALDWDTGAVELDIISSGKNKNFFILPSRLLRQPLAHATADESLSNFVERRVAKRLHWMKGRPEAAHVARWFDPHRPVIPPQTPVDSDLIARLKTFLGDARLAHYDPLLARRVQMVLDGLQSRIQLIQGPPGTGKTTLSAVAILTRIMLRRSPGDRILLTAHTHTAVDTLLERIELLQDDFARQAAQASFTLPPIKLLKVSNDDDDGQIFGRDILRFKARGRKTLLKDLGRDHVLVIGASTGGALKLAEELSKENDPFTVPLMVVDEASMLVCAHFLALASILDPQGSILMAGDNRQLAPIVSHDWEREDRPPAQLYRMHESTFDAIANMIQPRQEHINLRQSRLSTASVRRDGLQTTYRLPPDIRRLIQPLYDRDAITLLGPGRRQQPSANPEASGVNAIWQSGHGLYLVLHDERASQDANPTEVTLIQYILRAGLALDAIAPNSVAVITPHRAQRALLKTRLDPDSPHIRVIDTVERMQGGEAPTIIYSATASEPVSIARNAEFILGLERSNVAFSRTQQRLIVVCSRTLLDHIPMLVEHYDSALLWKFLRQMCTHPIGGGELGWDSYHVLTPHSGQAQP